MTLRTTCLALLLAAAGLCVGCGGDEPGDLDAGPDTSADTTPDDDTTPDKDTTPDEDTAQDTTDAVDARKIELRDLVTIANPSNVLSYFVEWRTDEPVASRLTVTCGQDYEQSWTLTPRTDHRVFVMGLVAGTTCEAAVEALDDDEAVVGAAEMPFEVGALPAFLPEIELLVSEPERMEPGWTMVNLTNPFDGIPFSVAVLDDRGRYRWYHQLPVDSAGSDTEIRQSDAGIVVCPTRGQTPLVEFDWQGNELWRKDIGGHHDCRFVGDDEQVVRLLRESSEGCPSGLGAAEIYDLDLATDEVLWSWRFCEHFEPEDPSPDWSHVNTLEAFPGDTDLLISSRAQHSLFKVDRDSGEVEWRLGLGGDFEMVDEDLFYRQHAPEIQPDGNIVLFDNGELDTREYSRLIEIAYDEQAMTAEVVWEFVPEPAIFAPIWGDADRQPNGNTLGTFGLRSPTEHTHIIEVDAQANEVWHVRLPLKWGTYRSDRIPQHFGHVIESP